MGADVPVVSPGQRSQGSVAPGPHHPPQLIKEWPATNQSPSPRAARPAMYTPASPDPADAESPHRQEKPQYPIRTWPKVLHGSQP